MTLRDDIQTAINRNSAENGSDTPDFILAEFLTGCLAAFDAATSQRDKWYAFSPWPKSAQVLPAHPTAVRGGQTESGGDRG